MPGIPPSASGGADVDTDAADTLYDYVNLRDLEEYATSCGDAAARQQACAYLKRVRNSGVPFGEEDQGLEESPESFLKVRVSYYRARKLPGGMYDSGPSIQNVGMAIRDVSLAGVTARDCDMRAARPIILSKLTENIAGGGIFPAIRSYVRYPTERRRYVSGAIGITESVAKTVIDKTFYGGDPLTDGAMRGIPELYLLATEVKVAARGALRLPAFTYLDGRPAFPGDSRNPTFARLSYAIGAVEDTDPWKSHGILWKKGRRVLANIHDGLIAAIPRCQADQIAGDLSSVEQETCYKFALKQDYYRSHKSASGSPDTIRCSVPVRGGGALSHALVLGRRQRLRKAIRPL